MKIVFSKCQNSLLSMMILIFAMCCAKASVIDRIQKQRTGVGSFIQELKEKVRTKRQTLPNLLPEEIIRPLLTSNKISRSFTQEIPNVIMKENGNIRNLKCRSCQVRRMPATVSLPSCIPKRIKLPTCHGLCETYEVGRNFKIKKIDL